MKVLLNNILESLGNAIEYHDRIISGFISLECQKFFVSSLHNAVELCIKQIMLDAGDAKVASIKNVKSKAIAELYCDYFKHAELKDLNEFFKDLPKGEMRLFTTIEFSRLLDLKSYVPNELKKSLTLLNALRNNETHFIINETFLNEEDFCELHNLMVEFYNSVMKDLLIKNGLVVLTAVSPFKKEGLVGTFSKDIVFSRDRLTSFDYNKAVSENQLSKYIQTAYDEYIEENQHSNTIFAILQSKQFKKSHPLLLQYTYNDIYSLMISMKILGMIQVAD